MTLRCIYCEDPEVYPTGIILHDEEEVKCECCGAVYKITHSLDLSCTGETPLLDLPEDLCYTP